MTSMKDLLDQAGTVMSVSPTAIAYSKRHGIRSASRLTVTDDEIGAGIAALLEERIRGKTVIDVGGGHGLLGMHLSDFAERVFVIEANPWWAATYVELFHRRKPPNLNFLFGSAGEFVDMIKGDVAVVATHSDVRGMMALAAKFAPTQIDIYGELIKQNPGAFDEWAREARKKS